MTTPSRVIPVAQAQAARAWSPPEVQGATLPVRFPTAQELDALQRAAHDEGYATGRAEGLARGLTEGRERGRAEVDDVARRLRALLNLLEQPTAALDAEVEHSLVELATLIARHIVRRELRSNPGEVVAVVREAVGQLPLATRHVRLHLNPEDADLVRNALALEHVEDSWHIEPDPLIARGGCRVETATSCIDASVEARLNAVIARMLGGERQDDR